MFTQLAKGAIVVAAAIAFLYLIHAMRDMHDDRRRRDSNRQSRAVSVAIDYAITSSRNA
jgi:hypothetical protein